MFNSYSYTLHYINYFLICYVFILQYHPDRNEENRKKQATIIFQFLGNHLKWIDKKLKTPINAVDDKEEESPSESSTCQPTQDSTDSTYYGAGYDNRYSPDFSSSDWKPFYESNKHFNDPNYWKGEEKRKESEACYENIYTPQQLSSYIWNLHQQCNPDYKHLCYLRKELQKRGLYPKYDIDSNGGTQTSEEELFETGSVIAIDSNGGTQTSEVEVFNGGTQTTQEEEWQDDGSVIGFPKQRLEQNNTINSNEDESDGNLSTDIHEVKETEDISEKASPTKDKTKNDALFAETKKKAATIINGFFKKKRERLHF